MENKIAYINGDATSPQAKGVKIIAHICNDIGGWGKGFVLAVSKKWSEPEKQYRAWYNSKENFTLGEVQFVQAEQYIYVANMIGQKGIKPGSQGPPIRYEAVEACLSKLAQKAAELNASVHMPRIGCGLAGGRWEKIEPLICRALIEKGVEVFVYDYK
ncbi:MAG: macro domain-containing protein [Gracilibacteraceae bacterium]|jgi:O-acetyl-ADP-ribose deacetylase (regulator of RNase III)|nr:macro domain-containing protein [Gracilibacteraceae bacterium]